MGWGWQTSRESVSIPDSATPHNTEGPGQDRPAPSTNLSVSILWPQFWESQMKKVLLALVFALSTVALVGCGGGSSTTGTKATGTK